MTFLSHEKNNKITMLVYTANYYVGLYSTV
jgi:hypothetical protein